jgi:hypothetical protein
VHVQAAPAPNATTAGEPVVVQMPNLAETSGARTTVALRSSPPPSSRAPARLRPAATAGPAKAAAAPAKVAAAPAKAAAAGPAKAAAAPAKAAAAPAKVAAAGPAKVAAAPAKVAAGPAKKTKTPVPGSRWIDPFSE